MQEWQLQPASDLGLPLREQLKSVRREGGLINVGATFAWSAMTATYLALYHRLKIEGRENLPRNGPFLLVANHCSHLDALGLAVAPPWRLRSDVYPIAAGDTFFSSRMKTVFSALVINALPMWRGRGAKHSLDDLRKRIAEGDGVYIIFPEGTRSRSGAMGEFKPGVGMLLAGTPVPVAPCRLDGTFSALPHDRIVPRPARLRLQIGKTLAFPNIPDTREGWQAIARTLQEAVSAIVAR